MPPTATKTSVMCPDDISGLVCLPPITDDLQVLWAQAELTEELDDHPQLMNTFSFFPYPSLPEIALLSLRYGLQMEKVKNWFMVQRIRCGISWTPEDIEETRSRLNYTQEHLHFKPLMSLARKSSTLRTEEFSVRVPKLCTKPGIAPRSLGDNEPQYKKMRLSSKHFDKEPKIFAEGTTTEHHMKRSSRDIANNSKHSSPVLSVHPKKRPILHNSVKQTGAGLILSPSGQEIRPDASYASDGEHPSSSWNSNNGEAAQLRAFFDQNGNFRRREDYHAASTRRQRKSKQQLSILKSFFLKCQWATREDYMMLEDITGLSRADIIQWFGDTRYALKHGNLRWFRDITQDPSSWVDDSHHPDNLNGGYSDSNSAAEELDPSMTDGLTSSSSRHLVHSMEDEEDIDTEPTSSTNSRHKASNLKLHVTYCSTPKSSRKSSTPSSLQRKYEILEDFWCSSQDLREGDLQKLVKETGLGRQQIVDWFTYKSKQSEDVDVCVVEDENDDGEEEEDDIQD
ncbi:homeobox and leucine zipper protein Homez [Gastrophryne carolinensis]